jgi:hypothetical protein
MRARTSRQRRTWNGVLAGEWRQWNKAGVGSQHRNIRVSGVPGSKHQLPQPARFPCLHSIAKARTRPSPIRQFVLNRRQQRQRSLLQETSPSRCFSATSARSCASQAAGRFRVFRVFRGFTTIPHQFAVKFVLRVFRGSNESFHAVPSPWGRGCPKGG